MNARRRIRQFLEASRQGRFDEVRRFLQEGIDVDVADDYTGWTALHWASLGCHADIVDALLYARANVNAVNKSDWTPLMIATWGGKRYEEHKTISIVETLLRAGADVNVMANDGMTALMSASKHGHENIVRLLLAARADIDARDQGGWTALHWASRWGRADVVRALRGADVNVVSRWGDTALDIAQRYHHPHVVAVLKELERPAKTAALRALRNLPEDLRRDVMMRAYPSIHRGS